MGGLLEDIRIYNNVSRGSGYFGIAVGTNGTSTTHPMSGVLIANNTVVGNGTTGWGGGITVYNPNASNVIVRNNLVSGNASFQIAVSASIPSGAVTVDHNLIYPFLHAVAPRGARRRARHPAFGERRQGFRPDGGTCSVPADARAVSANVTVTQPQAAGTLLVYPAGLDLPVTSTVSFAAGRTRANNAILGLSAAGEVQVHNTSAGTVHFIVDVNGYFR